MTLKRHNTKCTNTSFKHAPNLVCVQQFCTVCEDEADVEVDCQRCGKRKHSFWLDPDGDLMSYVFKSRPWSDRIVAIAHNAKAFDLLIVPNRMVEMKLLPELLVMNGQKIMCLKVENVTWLDSLNYMPMALRKLPEASGLSAGKLWNPHLHNTAENMIYVGPAPDVSYYSVIRCTSRKGRSFCRGTSPSRRRSSTTGACWNATARVT
jgi:hypothetical protein